MILSRYTLFSMACFFALGVLALFSACGDDTGKGASDAAFDGWIDGMLQDARPGPEASVDGGGCITDPDAADVDASSMDASWPDGGPMSDGSVDASTLEAGLPDGAMKDASWPDASLPDAQTGPDAWVPFDGGPLCPPDMVPVDGLFCIDVYEASRPDATATSYGVDSSSATSRAGVLPWLPVTLAQARTACENAGKRLCLPWEWETTCQGPQVTVYPYGDDYDPSTCNGIDTFCSCSSTECSSVDPCPYPHCYHAPPDGETSPSNGCGATFHVTATGSFPNCTNAYGTYDISGNVWEVVDTNDGQQHFRGGAFNCFNSENLHACLYDATWNPSAKGFRCCRDIP